MVTQVETKSPKYKRLSEAEMGRDVPNKFEEKDKLVIENLRVAFPYRAECAHRDGAGERIFSATDVMEMKRTGKRADQFNPKYGPCPAPIKDKRGNYSQRCAWQVPSQPTDKEIESYKNRMNGVKVKDRKGTIWNDVGITQYLVMKHHEENHFEWFLTEFGDEEIINGKTYLHPPATVTVVYPEWELE